MTKPIDAEGQLNVKDFAEFFAAVNEGRHPFRWQSRLVLDVWEQRRWPDLFKLPTAWGKTAIIDAAVFMLALDTQRDVVDRWMPRRIVMVVDRRVVVDQAAERAKAIVASLRDGKSEIVTRVASCLKSICGEEGIPMACSTLRGGVVRDNSWVRSVDQPLIITSTVDQVGSRLLFRGYGVSAGMRPIHAGLLSNDALLILDEVHLSRPFAQTLSGLTRLQRQAGEEPENRWHVTELSATPTGEQSGRWVFEPIPEDDRPGGDQPGTDQKDMASVKLLDQRRTASKQARLQLVKTSSRDEQGERKKIASACVNEVVELAKASHVQVVGVVVNRVDTARKIYEQLSANSDDTRDVVLLTGRMRSLERDEIVQALLARLASGRNRNESSRPLIVVATQCIEAGADFDFDALVTECASLDALRQRFGRLDRVGTLSAKGTPACAVVVGPSSAIADDADDPIYGQAISETWKWLKSQEVDGIVDFGISALGVPDYVSDGLKLSKMLSPSRVAPLLLPAYLDMWTERLLGRNSDAPDVAPWLHGPEESAADVQVVWREDLSETALKEASSSDRSLEVVRSITTFCRPLSIEALPVPVQAVRQWLVDGLVAAQPETGDVEGPSSSGNPIPRDATCHPFLIWRGEDSSVSKYPRDIRPGDTVVVPHVYGGVRHAVLRSENGNEVEYGWWSPSSIDPVIDLGETAHKAFGRWRIHRLFPKPDVENGPPCPSDRPDDMKGKQHLKSWVGYAAVGNAMADLRIQEFEIPGDDGKTRSWYAVSGRALEERANRPFGFESQKGDVDTEPDTSSFTGAFQATLDAHLVGVGGRAYDVASHCGLSEGLKDDLRLAGELHDIGKADERFQAWLRSGKHRPIEEKMLAKSAVAASDRDAREAARQIAGYPKGGHHEAVSAAMLIGADDLRERSTDWDLVQYLVSSHHGWGRPFFSPVLDPEPRDVSYKSHGEMRTGSSAHGCESFDSAVADRFWRLVERYGWFRLAWFEAMLRLADHRQSEEEQRRQEGKLQQEVPS